MKRTLTVILCLFAARVALAHGISDADQHSMIVGGNLEYARLGAVHMLTGYDHLLFLLGVVFFLERFRDITRFITAFTLGHCITLIFATFMGITANYFLIDAAIALTVVYKGFDNLGGFRRYLRMDSPNLLVLVFIFGLVHGFGLSTRLQQLPLGEDGLLLRILSFNLGVELGQIAALAVMLVVLNLWRRRPSFRRFSTAANLGLVAAGILLFAYQMSGYAGILGREEGEAAVRWDDTVTITIPAAGALEYKFRLAKDAPLHYAWQTDGGELFFDFHGEPAPGEPGAFASFEKDTRSGAGGTLAPPFTGSFGWYWRNRTDGPVEVRLQTRGEYEILGLQ